jgi:hypothetical protein
MALRKKCTGTCLVDRDSDMAEAVKQALAYKATQESVARFRERNSWEVRFSQAAIFAPSGLSASVPEAPGIFDPTGPCLPAASTYGK